MAHSRLKSITSTRVHRNFLASASTPASLSARSRTLRRVLGPILSSLSSVTQILTGCPSTSAQRASSLSCCSRALRKLTAHESLLGKMNFTSPFSNRQPDTGSRQLLSSLDWPKARLLILLNRGSPRASGSGWEGGGGAELTGLGCGMDCRSGVFSGFRGLSGCRSGTFAGGAVRGAYSGFFPAAGAEGDNPPGRPDSDLATAVARAPLNSASRLSSGASLAACAILISPSSSWKRGFSA